MLKFADALLVFFGLCLGLLCHFFLLCFYCLCYAAIYLCLHIILKVLDNISYLHFVGKQLPTLTAHGRGNVLQLLRRRIACQNLVQSWCAASHRIGKLFD